MIMIMRRFLLAGWLLLLLLKCVHVVVAAEIDMKTPTYNGLQTDPLDALASFIHSTSEKHGDRMLFLDLDGLTIDEEAAEKGTQKQERTIAATEENGGVKYTKCEDISEVYRRSWDRRYNGTNMLQEHYDCTCSEMIPADPTDYYRGDLGTIVTSCSLKEEKHCYNFLPYDIIWDQFLNASSSGTEVGVDPNNHEESVEQCVTHSMEITVWVNTTTTDTLITPIIAHRPKRTKSCFEFLQGGPQKLGVNENNEPIVVPGTYCYIHAPICYDALREDLAYSTDSTVEICNDRANCFDFFQQELAYTYDQALAICPNTQLNEQECSVSFNSFASNTTSCAAWEAEADTLDGVYIEDYYIVATLADCTNVLPCAKPSCAIIPRRDATLDHLFWTFPDCTNHTIELPENDDDYDSEVSSGFGLEPVGKASAVLMAIPFLLPQFLNP